MMKKLTIVMTWIFLILTSIPSSLAGTEAAQTDKWALWVGGTQLRGANIYQHRVYPELDGPDFLGPGPGGQKHER
jgi:hypothetical protein